MSAHHVNRWIICVTGFSQHEGRPSGLERLQTELHEQCGSPTTRVLLRSWKDSTAHLAERIWNWRPKQGQPAVVLIGYSYGGYSATLIAKELENRGIPVEAMLLVDPVWRPRRASLLSLLPFWTIQVPQNVRRLYAWHQKVNLPKGHHLKVSKRTYFDGSKSLNVIHQYCDDSMEVHNLAKQVSCPNAEPVT